jgi:hypothetical protein
MGLRCRQRLRAEDGVFVQQTEDGLLVVLASGPISPGDRLTADFVAQTLAGTKLWTPTQVLAALHAEAKGKRLVAATAALWQQQIEVAWLGDVRAHLIRRGSLAETTRDHTLLNDMGHGDAPDFDDANLDAARLARITTHILGGPDHPPDVRIWPAQAGDSLLMCSPEYHNFRPSAAYLANALDFDRPEKGRLLIESVED